MDQQEQAPSTEETAAPVGAAEDVSVQGVRISWQRVLIACLISGTLFLILMMAGNAIPLLIWLASVVFLPVGVWVGRGSQQAWADGTIYGLLSTLITALALTAGGGFVEGVWSVFYALFLALPQGILGTWLGARFFPESPARKLESGQSTDQDG